MHKVTLAPLQAWERLSQKYTSLRPRSIKNYSGYRRVNLTSRAIPPTIHSLPVEVLLLIFEHYINKDPTLNASLMLTCRRWAELVRGEPKLWNSVRLISTEGVIAPLHMQNFVETCVSRSQAAPLDIHLDLRGYGVTQTSMTDTKKKNSGKMIKRFGRGKSIVIITPPTAPAPPSPSSLHEAIFSTLKLTPSCATGEDTRASQHIRLRNFKLVLGNEFCGTGSPCYQPIFDGRETPFLRSIELRGWHWHTFQKFGVAVPEASFRHLRIQAPPGETLRTLKIHPGHVNAMSVNITGTEISRLSIFASLRSLVLGFGWHPQDMPIEPLELPQLEHLYLIERPALVSLSVITAPSLRDLCISLATFGFEDALTRSAAAYSTIRRLCWSRTGAVLGDESYDQELRAVLPQCKQLHQLQLVSSVPDRSRALAQVSQLVKDVFPNFEDISIVSTIDDSIVQSMGCSLSEPVHPRRTVVA